MRKVLIVTKSFKPDSSVSSFRASRFVKHLPEYGWQPYVLTLSEGDSSDRFDESYIERQKVPFEGVSITKDAGVRWLPSLITRATRIIKKERIDVFMITGPPFLTFPAAPVIKSLTDMPYILDLRDPWSLGLEERDNNLLEKIFNILTILSEPLIFQYSDHIILNSDRMRKEYEEKYGGQRYNITSRSLTTVRNGYDSNNHLTKHASRSKSPFTLIYPGKFRNSMEGMLTAFKRLSDFNRNCQFVHYGDPQGQYTDGVREVVSDLGLEERFNFRGFVDHKTVMSALDNANVGIAVTRQTDPTHIPMKIYDYIARDLPIVVLDDQNGAAAQLVKNFKHGYVATHEDIECISKILSHIYEENIDCLDESSIRAEHSMEKRVSEVAEILDSVYANRPC